MNLRIKELIWKELRPDEFRADVPGGHYLLFKNRNGMWILELYFGNAHHDSDDSNDQGEFSWAFIRPEKAKERANEDWREHIAPALEPVDEPEPKSPCNCGKTAGVEMRVYCDCGKRTGFSTDRKTVVDAWDKWVADGKSPAPVEDGELVAMLEEAEPFIQHGKWCVANTAFTFQCTCGVDDIRNKLQQVIARHKAGKGEV